MELEEAIKNTKNRIKSWENIAEIGKHALSKEEYENSQNICEEQKALIEELDRLQKENEELKAKQVMQEFKIDWCEKNTINKSKIKAIFSTYEARREQGEPVIGYYTLKEFVKKILGEK